jgi:hypothetical protein
LFQLTPKSWRLIFVVAVAPGAGLPVAVGDDAAELAGQLDLLGDAAHREVAGHGEAIGVAAEPGGGEGHRRVLLDEEEVARAQVLVARLDPRVHGRDVDGGLDRRVVGVLGGHDRHVERLEGAAHLADHEVLDREGDLGVGRIEFPGADDVVRMDAG